MSDQSTLTDGQARELARKMQDRNFGEPIRRFLATGEIAGDLRDALLDKQVEAVQADDDEAAARAEDLLQYVTAVGQRPPVGAKWAARP